MTNPELSIASTQQVGRLYQLPGDTYPKVINTAKAKQGLADGTLFPSITNVIGVANKNLEQYAVYMMGKALREGKNQTEAAKEYITFRDFAAARGSAVHLLIEQYIAAGNGSRGIFLPAFKSLPAWQEVKELGGEGYMRGFLKFCEDYQPKFLRQETTVYGSTISPDGPLNYAGTTDAIAVINGVLIVLDWKCTSKLHSSALSPQLGAVAKASLFHDEDSNEMDDWADLITGAEGAGVRLTNEGQYEIKGVEISQGWERFRKLHALWEDQAFGTEDTFRTPEQMFNLTK